MKKIILLLVICLLFISSGCNCNKNSEVHIYNDSTSWKEYLDDFYEAINTEGAKYAAFDLRSKVSYEIEHLRHFQNYDLNKGNIEEFNSYLTKNYASKYTIYIYIETLDNLEYFDDLLNTYKEVHIYIGDYESFRSLGEELFIFDSGEYDCNC